MALMGHGSMKRGPLLLGSSDGTMSLIDMRIKDEAMREKEMVGSRGIGKHRIVGVDTSERHILAGYSDCTGTPDFKHIWTIQM